MEPRHEALITALLIAACLAVFTTAAVPRWWPRPLAPVPIAHDLQVSVQGAVRRPGSYRLPWGARVEDLIEAAGGLTATAATRLVQPAAALSDGASLHVPFQRSPEEPRRVSLNEASLDELQTLPGIGPALAARIVTARPFHAVAELLRVRGIGPATLQAIRDEVTL